MPINVNYRYTPAELEYIFTNSHSVAVIVELPERQRALASAGGAPRGVRERTLAVKPDLLLRDDVGASESGNDGAFTVDEQGNLHMPSSSTMLLVDEDLADIAPGSDRIGYFARVGNVPLGYYKDEDKSARTFRTRVDGTRMSILGDMGRVEADGTIVFLGRGSQCIDTGGEKVFAEEVEAVLRAHPSIADALVVPVPDSAGGRRSPLSSPPTRTRRH